MIVLATPDETLALGARLGAVLQAGDVVTLAGPLGAGKTHFARGVLRGLGFTGEVPSPSFPLVIPYDPPAVRLPLAHVDLYRLDDDPMRVAELALEEARVDGAVLVEWPDRLGDTLAADRLSLTLVVGSDGARVLTAHRPPAWERRWPPT